MKNGTDYSQSSDLPLFGAEDFRAKTSQWLDSALAWLESEAAFGLLSEDCLRSFNRIGLSSKMSPDCFLPTADGTLPPSFPGWRNSGIGGPTGRLTLNTSTWPSDASVCSLSQVLETTVALKYYLSAKACAGILRRAAARRKELPDQLRRALLAVAATATTPTPPTT